MTWQERAHDQKFVEIVAVILMSLATPLSAWCAFEASVWTGRQSFAISESNLNYRRAAQAQVEGNQRVMIDVMQFIPYVQAQAEDRHELADFYFQHFRPELKYATKAWLATKPRENPDAPASPFAMPEYQVSQWDEAKKLDEKAGMELLEAHQDNFNSDMYVLTTVLFSVVLFAGGIAPKLVTHVARWMLLSLGIVVFICAVLWMLRRPAALSERPTEREIPKIGSSPPFR